MRLWLGIPVGVVVAAVVSACGGDNQECTTCPKLEGKWALTAGGPDRTCSPSEAPPASIDITRVGAAIRSQLPGGELTGTIYDTYDFTLSGSVYPADGGISRADSLSIRARFIPGGPDAGDTFTGTWTFSPAADAGTAGCVETRALNAARL